MCLYFMVQQICTVAMIPRIILDTPYSTVSDTLNFAAFLCFISELTEYLLVWDCWSDQTRGLNMLPRTLCLRLND